MNMEFEESDNWDVEQYRHPWDCDEHWEIRKNFLLTYKDRFPKERLVCLAQVYANIELLGCRYPAEVTKQIRYLAEDLKTENRKKDKQRINFVKSDECQDNEPRSKKIKQEPREDRYEDATSTINGQNASDLSSNSSFNKNLPNNENNCFIIDKVPSYFTSNYRTKNNPLPENQQASKVKTVIEMKRKQNSKKRKQVNKAPNSYLNRQQEDVGGINLPSAELNLFRKNLENMQKQGLTQNILHIISQCADKAHIIVNYLVDPDPTSPALFLCTLQVNFKNVSQGRGHTKKIARTAAATEFVNNLLLVPAICVNDTKNKASACPVIGRNKNQTMYNSFNNDLSDFIVIEPWNIDMNNPQLVLFQSASFNKKVIKYEFDRVKSASSPVRCSVYLDSKLISSAGEMSKQKAKHAASLKAIENLKNQCYTIKQKMRVSSQEEVTKGSVASNASHEALPETNIGNKMMRLMGWTGGGLGKGEDGIEEPIRLQTVIGRSGLGSSTSASGKKSFRKMITDKILAYVSSDSMNDLVFTSEFTKEERKEIHQIAQRYHLKSVSHGSGDQRHLVVSRKWTPNRLFDYVKSAGGSTDKYELIPPTFH